MRSILDDLTTYGSSHPEEVGIAGVVAQFVQQSGAHAYWSHPPAHVTASCLIVHYEGNTSDAKIALVDNRLYDRFLPPGGHLESGEPTELASIREAHEELGLPLEPLRHGRRHGVFDIDIHPAVHPD